MVDTTAARDIRLAVVAGDGIGTEVVEQGLLALDTALHGGAVTVSTTDFDLGARRWHATGETLTDTDLDAIRAHDAILLGAIGDPSVPSGVLERGLLLKLRFALDHYVNLRPSRLYPGVASPAGATRARSTSWWSARAPRARTSATAAPSASAPRTRWPTRSA